VNTASIVAVVPFYNRQHTILTTLQSVGSQTLRPKQLILVDDGSSDRGVDVATSWMEHVRGRLECRLVQTANRGPGAARNYGLSLAHASDYVAFLDSDDCWPPDFLERTYAAISTRPGAVAATCDREFVFADGRPSKREDCSSLAISPNLWMLGNGAGVVSNTLFRRSTLERRNGFDSRLNASEETKLFLSLASDGSWLHVTGNPVLLGVGMSQQQGDEGNRNQKHLDGLRNQAKIYEHFFVQGAGRDLLTNPQCRKLLAERWYRAGRQLHRLHAHREALACFQKSLSWNSWRVKCYTRLCRAWLGTFSRRSITIAPINARQTASPGMG
jgi:hypothetical protein